MISVKQREAAKYYWKDLKIKRKLHNGQTYCKVRTQSYRAQLAWAASCHEVVSRWKRGTNMNKKLNIFVRSICIFGILFFACVLMKRDVMASSAVKVDTTMLQQINGLRTQKGLPKLILDDSLTKIAEVRANEASFKWSHERPNGEQGSDMIARNKWRGENLSYVNSSNYNGTESEQVGIADLMFTNLCNSPTYLDNMLFSEYTKIGISSYEVSTANGKKITTAYMFSN